MAAEGGKPSAHDVMIGEVSSDQVGGREVGFGLVTLILQPGTHCGRRYHEYSPDKFYRRYLGILKARDQRETICNGVKPF